MPGCGIYSGTRGIESFVGRLETVAGAPASQRLECPVQLKRSADNDIHALATSGQKRIGKPTDVKPGLHWLLVPREKGGYHLQPVSGWYDFPKPIAATVTVPAINCARPLVITSGEAELRHDATERREFADRWAGMLERRAARTGVKVKNGKALDQLLPDEGDMLAREKTEKVFLPDDERLNDEMGLRKQRKKKTKALRKEAGALNNVEDAEEVPDTANALLGLKREKGEAGWDVDDDELFSDDEQELDQFDGNLDNPDPQEVEAGLSADEEDAEDDEKDLLTSHGRQLETLLENADEQFENLRDQNQVDSASDDDGEQNDCQDDRPTKKQKIETPSATVPAPAMHSTSSSSSAVPLAVSAEQARATLPETEEQHKTQSDDPWKQKAIDFLRQKGGKCTLKDMSKLLNLSKLKKTANAEEYQRVVDMLKEVSTVVNQTDLILNEQYQKHQDEKKGLTPASSPLRPEPSPSPPADSGRPGKSKPKEKVVAPDERQDRFESMVSKFVSQLHKKGFKSRLQAAEYLESKTKGNKGLTESEVSEILRRFCRECKRE